MSFHFFLNFMQKFFKHIFCNIKVEAIKGVLFGLWHHRISIYVRDLASFFKSMFGMILKTLEKLQKTKNYLNIHKKV